ncbi:MAG: MFS transporter [Eubacteriales bacterium]|nr:MFS transporter [Eubacteriales bacterium]
MSTEQKKLWTKDFTILTLGTVVSMLGNAVAGFAIGLLVLDQTDSVLLYAAFMTCYSLPKILLPMFAGPYLDRFSRKRVIYSLDFLSAVLYLAFFLLLNRGFFNYTVYLLLSVVIGSIDSVYGVAYETFYPLLISEGNFTRAYSIDSLIYPLSTAVMVPVAGLCYKTIGLAPLFLFNAFTFLVAAIFETQIKAVESHLTTNACDKFDGARFFGDLKEGFAYLKRERGLKTITWFFFVMMFTSSVCMTLTLPYFKSLTGVDGVMQYTFVMGANTIGRLVGGSVHYFFRYPEKKKYNIALIVYVAISVIDGAYLFFPFWVMLAIMFLDGMLGVTSYNIRISSTQNYLPDEMRGRFNGLFQMLIILGTIGGQLVAGAVGDTLPIRWVVAAAMAVTLISVFVIVIPNGESVKKIYNVNV